MKPFSYSDNRGSALLIVLGLLSFLMISAVAFSISMRTERTAAAAYRRGLLARELLDNAFVDARSTVEHTLRSQQQGFDVRNPSTHTIENLAPFRYGNEDRYGRVLSSYDASEGDATAYLLDEAVMRHVPPYVANAVYNYLEKNQSITEGDGYNTGTLAAGYKLDAPASWKTITVDIPDAEENISGEDTSKAVIGRMAWAVVNLSDSLDINAIGSASSYRGIGLTASEFAFGTAATGSTAPTEFFDLLETTDSPEGSEVKDLPVFCSNADIARYAEKASGSTMLVTDNGNEFPYSWQDAVDNDGDGFYSPFSCYSFWPHADRKSEGEDRRAPSNNEVAKITCDKVTQSALMSGLDSEIQDVVTANTDLDATEALSFVQLLTDYVDQYSIPEKFERGAMLANARPTVESVPMVSEVAYDASSWASSLESKLKDAIEASLGSIETGKLDPATAPDQIRQNLADLDLELEIPMGELDLAVRTYCPGYEELEESSFDVAIAGFAGVGVAMAVGSEKIANEGGATQTKSVTEQFQAIDTGTLFYDKSGIAFAPSNDPVKIKFKGDKIPVTYIPPTELNGATPPPEQPVTLSFVVDYFFHVDVVNGGDEMDRCPADRGRGEEYGANAYPTSLANRVNEPSMSRLDSQYFRVSCPMTVTFSLAWDLKVDKNPNDNSTEIKYTGVIVHNDKVTVEAKFDQKLTLGDVELASCNDTTASSCKVLSPEKGTWYTVDPRYNWLSPMLGLSDGSVGAYSDVEARQNLSSPHWLFVEERSVTTGNGASTVQQDYAEKNESYIPFSWGLMVEDIRYGHNDSGQLLLPGEVGFLPVPMSVDQWHPNETSYNRNSVSDYYNKVAKASFFRTIPVVDLKDGAMDYSRYTKLVQCFGSFASKHFPEEHRGLVNVFAAQDNYYVAQQLRQFAMLGIPSCVKQAAKVTFDRLKSASSVYRVSEEMVNDLSSTLGQVDVHHLEPPKYDEFVTKYLFPLPTSGGPRNRRNWNGSHKLFEGGPTAQPERPRTLDFIMQEGVAGATFADRLAAYNDTKSSDQKLGQKDMTTLLSVAKECFGDRQQLFLYILRADAIAYNSGRELSKFRPLSTARAVALVWRDAYGELPDRVIYYQVLP